MLDEKTEKEVNSTLKQLESIPNVEISKVMLGISGPPCSGCRHWKPYVKVKRLSNGKYRKESVVLCAFEGTMYSDFSCYDGGSGITGSDSSEEEDFALEV